MLRNTFVWAAHTFVKPQIISKFTKYSLSNTIRPTSLMHEVTMVNYLPQIKCFSTNAPCLQKDEIEVFFIKFDGTKIRGTGKIGDSLLDVVVNNNIDIDGFGACEGTLTCSTCHLIFKEDDFNRLPEKPGDEELDMLDLAYELTDNSRLGCQIVLTKELNGLEVRVPSTINDARS